MLHGRAVTRLNPLILLDTKKRHVRHKKATTARCPYCNYYAMSTRYWWPRPDSNRHSGFPEADFKSAVSTVPPRGPRARVLAPPVHAPEAHERRSIRQRVAPDAFPILAAEVGHAAVALVEFVGDLEH